MVALGGVAIPHGHQQFRIFLQALHQDGAKRGRRSCHSTWSLDDPWAAFPWVQPVGGTWPILSGTFWTHGRKTYLGYLDSEKLRETQDFANFTANFHEFHTLSHSSLRTLPKNPTSAACNRDSIHVFSHYSRFIDQKWGWEQRSFENEKICCACKLSICDHRLMKLTPNCVNFTPRCINLLVPFSVTRGYQLKALELIHMLQRIAAYLQLESPWVSEDNIKSGFLVMIFIPAWLLHAAENWTSACWSPCSHDASSTKSSTKANNWSSSF